MRQERMSTSPTLRRSRRKDSPPRDTAGHPRRRERYATASLGSSGREDSTGWPSVGGRRTDAAPTSLSVGRLPHAGRSGLRDRGTHAMGILDAAKRPRGYGELSAAEWYTLLCWPESGKSSQSFKLAMLELVARHVLEVAQVDTAGRVGRPVTALFWGTESTDNRVLLSALS